jgi:hypothetical protein
MDGATNPDGHLSHNFFNQPFEISSEEFTKNYVGDDIYKILKFVSYSMYYRSSITISIMMLALQRMNWKHGS